MDEKLKIFWNLDVLVKMCRSKSDGPSLRIEEEEILEKISSYESDIEEIKAMLEEDTYDTSAEMADRNIEIITKKQLQSLKSELKEKNKELNKLKDEENILYNQTSLLRENKASNEKYIASMQERLGESTDRDVLDRYNALITETLTKINELTEKLREENTSYEEVQTAILQASADIEDLEARIDKKKKLLAETQANLENKENYVDKSKRDKNNKKIKDIEVKIEGLQKRLEEIRKDPKYIETKIKDIINSKEDKQNARDYLSELVKIVINQPYINVPTDNSLEEELLRATQARDSFANEIDQKSYNILEANTPEKIRTDFLNKRIENWREELTRLHNQINQVDKDVQYNYEEKDRQLEEMIKSLKNDLREFEKAYAETTDTNIGAKASLEVALEEKKEDIQEAEKIANAFKTNEAEDIANATRTIKYQCEQLNNDIKDAEEEIKRIRNRLMSRKSGLIDIASRNKDKDVLRDLAQTVIDIKHRRQFPETPLDIIRRLEEELDVSILTPEDLEQIEKTSVIVSKNYDEYISKKFEIPENIEEATEIDNFSMGEEKELTDVDIMNPEDLIDNDSTDEDFQKLANQAMGFESPQPTTNEMVAPPIEDAIVEEIPTEPAIEEAPVVETPAVEPTVEAPPAVEETTTEVAPLEEPAVEEPIIEETSTEESGGESTEEPVIEETPSSAEINETTEEDTTPEETSDEQGETVAETSEEETTEGDTTVVEPTEETPVEETATEEVPVEEAPIEEVTEEAVEETPVEEIATEEAPIEETPVEEVASEENATEEAPAEEVVEEAPVEETPSTEEVNEAESKQEETEGTPVEETPAEEVNEQVVETPAEESEEVSTPSLEDLFGSSITESTEEVPIEETSDTEISVEAPEVNQNTDNASINQSDEETPTAETQETTTEQPPEEVPVEETTTQVDNNSVGEATEVEQNNELQENPFGDMINPIEQETTPEAEEVIELSSNDIQDNDLSINSMFSNSIELSDDKDNEEVRNNLSNELDSFINNLDDTNN